HGLLRALRSFPTRRSSDLDGWFAGGQVGCDYQLATNWVIGAEVTGSWADVNGSVLNAGGIIGHTLEHRLNGFVTATGRLGYAMRSEEHTSELQSPYDIVCR